MQSFLGRLRVLLSLVVVLSALAQLAAQTPSLTVTSPAFRDGDKIPKQHASVSGSKNASPPLAWSGAPASTKHFAVIFEDLDAVEFTPRRPRVQWIVYNIPGSLAGLPEHVPPGAIVESGPLTGVIQGMSDLDRGPERGTPVPNRYSAEHPGYDGIQPIHQVSSSPPKWRAKEIMTMARPATKPAYRGPLSGMDRQPHRFVFTVFAIDEVLDLKPGLNTAALLKAIEGHIVAEGRLGVFSLR